jgi:hypothetical protein
MKSKGAKKLLLVTTLASALALPGSNALASSAAQIEAGGSGTVTYDNGSGAYPVVSAILTAPVGSLDGYTYSTWAFLAQDSTGSLDMFYRTSAYSGYSPTLGDAITVSGAYAPFDGIPEIGTPLSVTLQSSGNPVPAPTVVTIPQINVSALNSEGLASSYAGYYLEVQDVTLGNAGSTWTTHANVTTSITDQSDNTMVLYDWASSYSTCGALGGTVAPTGLVDVYGFVDFFASSSEAEFVPTLITPVPEPSAMSLCGGIGSLLAWICYRWRKKA